MKVIDQWDVGTKLFAALRSQWWSSEQIRHHQQRSLVGMMRHAAANVPFYQRLRLPATTILDAADLERFPVIVSEQAPELLAASTRSGPSGLGVFFSQQRVSIHTPVAQHLEVLAQYRPHIVYAFPSYLLDLYARAGRHGLTLPKIETLYTSSEVLTPAARARIENAFSGRLYDVYGSTEFKEVAWQCRAGRYHVNVESVYVEGQAADVRAPVILSTLCNVAMPLLRFDIGDRAVFGLSL